MSAPSGHLRQSKEGVAHVATAAVGGYLVAEDPPAAEGDNGITFDDDPAPLGYSRVAKDVAAVEPSGATGDVNSAALQQAAVQPLGSMRGRLREWQQDSHRKSSRRSR